MSSTKKPRKHYRPRDPSLIKLKMQPWKVSAVVNPLLAIVDQLEQQGTIDIASGGQAVFRDDCDGIWYDSAAAILGVVEAYEILEIRKSINLNLDPLRKLSKKLEYQMPIEFSDTQAARACIERIRQSSMEMTAGEAKELIQDFQIKEKMQEVA